MSIIFFTKYTSAGASSRYRVYQYLSYYQTENIKCKVAPLFNEDYISNLNRGEIKWSMIFLAYVKRFFTLLTVFRYKIIYIEYELFPYFPSLFEFILKFLGCKIITDYDDAIFHNYDAHKSIVIRFFLKNKIRNVMRCSNTVVCGSPYLTRYAKAVNESVIEIPTSIYFHKYNGTILNKQGSGKFIIGWIGSKTTSKNILMIAQALREFSMKKKCEIRLIGFDESLLKFLDLENIQVIKWDAENEIVNIKEFTVGIMPLEDKLFEKGKCGFKLIQYMACGVPTISTPFEANIKINRDNGNLFAANHSEWIKCFESVYDDPIKFCEIGMKNKYITEKFYSVESNFRYYLDMFKSLS